MVGMTPMRSSPWRGGLGARHFGQFFGFAEDGDRLVGDLLAQRRETNDAPRALDQRQPEQSFEFAKARRQGRLSDETGFRRFPEMAVAAQRDEILELLNGRKVDDH